jgi:hypothetical protein
MRHLPRCRDPQYPCWSTSMYVHCPIEFFLFLTNTKSHNNSSTFSFSIPIATSFSSSFLRPYEQHPPPHPPQVCSTLRLANLLYIHIPLNIPMHFLSLSYPCTPSSCCASNATRYELRYSLIDRSACGCLSFCCRDFDLTYRLRRRHSLRF